MPSAAEPRIIKIGLTFFIAAATAAAKIPAVHKNSGWMIARHETVPLWKNTVGSIPHRAHAISPTTAGRKPYITPLTARLVLNFT